ncbi:MAG: energy transducer TonB [Desulfobulbaceae bacterium]
MARLLPALLLALGLHLLLFRVVIPVQESRSPVLSGHNRVTVTLARPAMPLPEPAAEKPAAEPLKPKPAPQEPPVEDIPERKPPAASVPRPAPEQRKQELPARMERPDDFAPVAQLPRGVSESTAQPTVAAAEANAGPESAAAALRQAVPLAADNRPPEYPALARKRGWEGRVLLAVEVAADGTAREVRVEAGSSHDLLDEAALRAVRKWRFQPGTRDGEPVAMQVLVPVHFILKDNP